MAGSANTRRREGTKTAIDRRRCAMAQGSLIRGSFPLLVLDGLCRRQVGSREPRCYRLRILGEVTCAEIPDATSKLGAAHSTYRPGAGMRILRPPSLQQPDGLTLYPTIGSELSERKGSRAVSYERRRSPGHAAIITSSANVMQRVCIPLPRFRRGDAM